MVFIDFLLIFFNCVLIIVTVKTGLPLTDFLFITCVLIIVTVSSTWRRKEKSVLILITVKTAHPRTLVFTPVPNTVRIELHIPCAIFF